MRLEPKVEKQFRKRIVRNFLDILILSRLENSEPMSGYDFVGLIHKEFDVSLGAGTIYSSLYALERKGFIEGYSHQRKRVYKIVNRGRQYIEAAYHAMNSGQNLIKKIMKK